VTDSLNLFSAPQSNTKMELKIIFIILLFTNIFADSLSTENMPNIQKLKPISINLSEIILKLESMIKDDHESIFIFK